MRDHASGPDISANQPTTAVENPSPLPSPDIHQLLIAIGLMRQGIAQVHAGRLDAACDVFQEATAIQQKFGFDTSLPSLPTMLASCLTGRTGRDDTQRLWARESTGTRMVSIAIRRAWALSASGDTFGAINLMQSAINTFESDATIEPSPEPHVQLGLLYVQLERMREAEVAFRRALAIQPHHSEALVNLALCLGMRHVPSEALPLLEQAQHNRPFDARIALLLTLAMKASGKEAIATEIEFASRESQETEHQGIEDLARIIAREPDFVDAFMSIPLDDVDGGVFAVLLQTLEAALACEPEHAELHFHCGQILEKLGRRQDAIDCNERAVAINPTYTRALIGLGRLYESTDQCEPALARLESAVAAGADYADVHYLLGNLYRREGKIDHARKAYARALDINDRYVAARQALDTLAV